MKKRLLLLLLCVACQRSPHFKTYERNIMSMDLRVQTTLPEKQVKTIINSTFKQIDQIFNNWNPKSEVSKLNQLPAYEQVELSEEMADFLHKVAEIVEISEGRFDPTVGSLVHMWKTHLKNGNFPPQPDIDRCNEMVGWDKIHLNGRIFYKEQAGIELDFGGIAKGYAVDKLIAQLPEGSYVEWGGEVGTKGSHPRGRPWKVAIWGGGVVEVEDKMIATSGGYIQKWRVGDEEYTHFIDPFTKLPIRFGDGILSATVITSSGMMADGLATALSLFENQKEALAWIRQFPDVEVRLYDAAGWGALQ